MSLTSVGIYEFNAKDLIGHGAFAVVYKGRLKSVSEPFSLLSVEFESPPFIHGNCVKQSQVRYRQSSVLCLVQISCRRLCDSPEVVLSMISN